MNKELWSLLSILGNAAAVKVRELDFAQLQPLGNVIACIFTLDELIWC